MGPSSTAPGDRVHGPLGRPGSLSA